MTTSDAEHGHEEVCLERKFGDAYLDYKSRVRLAMIRLPRCSPWARDLSAHACAIEIAAPPSNGMRRGDNRPAGAASDGNAIDWG
jgi:hypothetical protein